MNAILVSLGLVAAAEIGDKTQLLALILAARFRRPVPVVLGILAATLVNHAMAAGLGVLVAEWLSPQALRWVVAASFLGMAAWTLIPDKMEGEDPKPWDKAGAFVATAVSFFLAEMGDKTQVATIALGARFGDMLQVTIGTTLGMLIADVPAVFVGNALAERLPIRLIHLVAAGLFAALGVAALLDWGSLLGHG